MMECGDAPPQSQSQPTATVATATTSAEEQALKRNTDCVYFLASPLTCKKGSECEYRHSDVARVNPRDCWFWLNGNCLNPKCGFRHPPLDGLLGSQVSNPVGSSVHPAHVEAASEVHPYTSNKQGVPCIFFQKGFCLKGDRCSFLHAPNPVSKKVPQGPAATTTSDPQSLKRAFGVLEKFTQVQNVAKTNAPNSHGSRPQEKLAIKVETALTKNSITVNKNAVPPSGSADRFMRYIPENVTTAINGNLGSRSNRHQANLSDDHGSLVGKDADDLSREPSPGFDVLVDDEHRDSDYYNDEDQYRRSRGHDGTYLSSMKEYDIGHSAEYGAMIDADQDIYHDSLGYDLYDHMHGQYGRERRRSSSAQPEIRQFPGGKSYDKIDDLDLRHHLSKRKRANALRSVINHDNASENHVEDQNHHVPRRDTRHSTAHESWLSSRLKGRITIPGRSSSPVNGSDLRSGREFDWGRNQNRLSSGRLRIPHLGRLRDRIKGRIEDVVSNDGRNPRGAHLSRESVHENGADFARPRSLAELKDGKNTRTNEQHKEDQQFFTLGKIKYPRFEDYQQSGGDLSFEGPKPLSEILKRKKEADISASESGMTSNNNGNNGQKKVRRGLIKSTAILVKQATHFSESKDEGFRSMHGTNKLSKFENSRNDGAEDGSVVSEKSTEDQSSLGRHHVNELQSEDPDSVMVDEATEDHETEAYDHRDGYYVYEQIEGEAFEGENDEDEYLDDDDDDFAKKMGVVYS